MKYAKFNVDGSPLKDCERKEKRNVFWSSIGISRSK